MTAKVGGVSKTLRRYDVAINSLLPALMLRGWDCRKNKAYPEPGDMVILQSAPPSEWDLSIYRSDEGNGFHLIESMRTGVIGRWSNVGFHVINCDQVHFPRSVAWTDEQFAFDDKFRKAFTRGDFHMAVPFIDRFDGDTAHIIFRTRHNIDQYRTPVEIVGWQKITQKALLAQLLEAEASHKAKETQP